MQRPYFSIELRSIYGIDFKTLIHFGIEIVKKFVYLSEMTNNECILSQHADYIYTNSKQNFVNIYYDR